MVGVVRFIWCVGVAIGKVDDPGVGTVIGGRPIAEPVVCIAQTRGVKVVVHSGEFIDAGQEPVVEPVDGGIKGVAGRVGVFSKGVHNCDGVGFAVPDARAQVQFRCWIGKVIPVGWRTVGKRMRNHARAGGLIDVENVSALMGQSVQFDRFMVLKNAQYGNPVVEVGLE